MPALILVDRERTGRPVSLVARAGLLCTIAVAVASAIASAVRRWVLCPPSILVLLPVSIASAGAALIVSGALSRLVMAITPLVAVAGLFLAVAVIAIARLIIAVAPLVAVACTVAVTAPIAVTRLIFSLLPPVTPALLVLRAL